MFLDQITIELRAGKAVTVLSLGERKNICQKAVPMAVTVVSVDLSL